MSRPDIDYAGNVAVARPQGDVDAFNAARLRDDLFDSLPRAADELVLDLTGTRYVDSAGIDMLFRVNARLRERRAILRIVITRGSQLDRLAEIVGLRATIAVYDTVDEALRAGAATNPAPHPG